MKITADAQKLEFTLWLYGVGNYAKVFRKLIYSEIKLTKIDGTIYIAMHVIGWGVGMWELS